MTIDEFVKKFSNLLDDTAPETITAKTTLKDLDEWNSLLALSIISMADEDFGVLITGDEIEKCGTVEDLFQKISNKMA